MLAVPIELNSDVIAHFPGVEVAGLHRAANAQVLQQTDVMDAIFQADPLRAIGGTIIDDHIVQAERAGFPVLPHPADHAENIGLFIISWDNQQHPHPFPFPHGHLPLYPKHLIFTCYSHILLKERLWMSPSRETIDVFLVVS